MSDQFNFIGSVFSRNPINGERGVYGCLFNLYDFTTVDIAKFPEKLRRKLEKRSRMQEKRFKFVVESIISYNKVTKQYRVEFDKRAKIEGAVYPKVLLELYKEKIISQEKLFENIPLNLINRWLSSQVRISPKAEKIASGRAITYGAQTGELVIRREQVESNFIQGKKSIWILSDVTQEDLEFFKKCHGLVLTKSGPTSHAAVIAKSYGIPCILGCENLLHPQYMHQIITIDANGGYIYKGKQELIVEKFSCFVDELLKLAVKSSKIQIYANADTSADSEYALKYHVQGIALCRTEHMFIGKEGRTIIRKILLEKDLKKDILEQFIRKQADDFFKLFYSQEGNRIVVRYLDAPLHEFIEKKNESSNKFCEVNPMLGYRGARFLILNPMIIRIQTRAIFRALSRLKREGKSVFIGLEIPLVVDPEEINIFSKIIKEEIESNPLWKKMEYEIGTMIETPRAGFLIKEIAPLVGFLSFGTNDLTQTIFAISRDDSETFVPEYINKNIFNKDPFNVLDEKGLGGFLIKVVSQAKRKNPKIHISICGEQAADADSIKFIIKAKIDAIGVSPARLPRAIFAAAKFSR